MKCLLYLENAYYHLVTEGGLLMERIIKNDSMALRFQTMNDYLTNVRFVTMSDYLTYLRLRSRYSQEYVAERVHIIRQAYSHYETGRSIPSIVTLYNLCLLYDLPTCPILKLGAINEHYIDSVDELDQMDSVEYLFKFYEERDMMPK